MQTRPAITTEEFNGEGYESRYTGFGSFLQIREYASTSDNYESVGISVHDADLSTVKVKTRTIKQKGLPSFKVKTISFIGRDGLKHEIKLFS